MTDQNHYQASALANVRKFFITQDERFDYAFIRGEFAYYTLINRLVEALPELRVGGRPRDRYDVSDIEPLVIEKDEDGLPKRFPCRDIIDPEKKILLRRFLLDGGDHEKFDLFTYPKDYKLKPREDGTTLYLHQILEPDTRGPLHTHPFEAALMILSGGYDAEEYAHHPDPVEDCEIAEQLLKMTNNVQAAFDYMAQRHTTRTVSYREGDCKRLVLLDAHRIDKVLPGTWTLFLTAPRHQHKWGFLHPQRGYMLYDEYFNLCERLKAKFLDR